jgi:hypothetical protein
MLTTYNKETWTEDPDMERRIMALIDARTSDAELRKMFPFKGIAKKRLIPYGIPEGSVIPYVLVKHEVSLYPMVGAIGVGGHKEWSNGPRRLILDSNEIQLVEA